MINFSKMHGCGNDYIYIDCFHQDIDCIKDFPKFVKNVSDRHFGIGSDGVILILPSKIADAKMKMYNADGSEGAMCGNGIRCVGKYVYEKNICKKEILKIETNVGIKQLQLHIQNDLVESISVDMGEPSLNSSDIPVLSEKNIFKENIVIDNTPYYTTCVSMGNPHAIVYMNDVDGLEIEKIGPSFENHINFPDRVNTEFVKVIDRHTVQMRVWERGSGETLACGTGACAVAVASILNGLVDRDQPVTVKLLGGDLNIFWDENDDQVYMTGPATTVFDGEIDLGFLGE